MWQCNSKTDREITYTWWAVTTVCDNVKIKQTEKLHTLDERSQLLSLNLQKGEIKILRINQANGNRFPLVKPHFKRMNHTYLGSNV